MKLVNLTGRMCSIYDTNGELVDLPPDARYVGLTAVGDHKTLSGGGRSFSLNIRRVSGVKGMPEPDGESVYIVPVEIAMALQEEREDVVYLAEDAEVRIADGGSRRISHLRRTVRRHTDSVAETSIDGQRA